MLWVLATGKPCQVWLLVCGHMHNAGYRGVEATLYRLRAYST